MLTDRKETRRDVSRTTETERIVLRITETVTVVVRRIVVRTAADRMAAASVRIENRMVIVARAEDIREMVRIVSAMDVTRMAVPRGVSMVQTKEEQIMADLPTTRMVLRNLPDLASKVARVSAAVAAAARAVAVVLAVIAAIAEPVEDREIDSAISHRLKDSRQKLLQKTSRKSVKKKRDASVRKKTNATARI